MPSKPQAYTYCDLQQYKKHVYHNIHITMQGKEGEDTQHKNRVQGQYSQMLPSASHQLFLMDYKEVNMVLMSGILGSLY